MKLNTRVFELSNRKYRNLAELAQARIIYPLFLLPLTRGREHRPFKPEASIKQSIQKPKRGLKIDSRTHSGACAKGVWKG